MSASANSPSIRLLLDENLPKKLVEELSKEYDCLPVNVRMTNGDIGKLAIKEKRIILTQDKHFANITLFPPKEFSGIIRIRIHPPIISSILDSLRKLFHKLNPRDIDKKLVVLEKDDFRIR
jgi:predicted nuclease of predicted toxin-antitoxin system